MVRGCGSLKKCPHPLIKPRSLVLWHYVTAWGFFYVLSSCNTPKQQMTKRPKLRINTGFLSDRDGSEFRPVRVTVRWWRHDWRMMKSDGSEGTERKAGPEDDVQRTCHFSTKSRSMRLSLHKCPKRSQYLCGFQTNSVKWWQQIGNISLIFPA